MKGSRMLHVDLQAVGFVFDPEFQQVLQHVYEEVVNGFDAIDGYFLETLNHELNVNNTQVTVLIHLTNIWSKAWRFNFN